ncbi:tetratricopeptide repeat protein [Candidatus Obscuribacterales bacterium]|nr:tetratricopeptide repeat protein [Candidatus Obscuribacterales bacterium]
MTAKHNSILDSLRLATPCTKDWDKMDGDERVRFCGGCEKNVYNISDMTRREANAFLQEHGLTKCMRISRRHDGTVITDDCPVGLRKARERFRRIAKVASIAIGFLFASFGKAYGADANLDRTPAGSGLTDTPLSAVPNPPVTGTVELGGEFKTDYKINLKVGLDHIALKKAVKARAKEVPRDFIEALKAQLTGKTDRAISRYEKAIASHPTYTSSYNNLAICLLNRNQAGDLARAGEVLTKVEHLVPKTPAIYLVKAAMCDQNGDLEGEIENLRMFRLSQPSSPGAVFKLVDAYDKLKQKFNAYAVLVSARSFMSSWTYEEREAFNKLLETHDPAKISTPSSL